MIMSSTCRNLLFDTLHVCCWINCIIWKFLSGIGFRWSWPRAFKLLTNHNDFIASPRNKITRPIESSEKSTTNSRICHPPSFSLWIFQKKISLRYWKNISKNFRIVYRTRNSYLLYGEMLETKFILRSKFKDNFGGK